MYRMMCLMLIRNLGDSRSDIPTPAASITPYLIHTKPASSPWHLPHLQYLTNWNFRAAFVSEQGTARQCYHFQGKSSIDLKPSI